MTHSPFTDTAVVTGALYATADRLTRRTGALHAAKVSGPDVADTIARVATRCAPLKPVVCDIGCGRGTTTMRLAQLLAPARLVAVDRSPPLLRVAADRARCSGYAVDTVCADFHRLPLPDASIDIAVAAFCLYHSPQPARVVAEIARSTVRDGRMIFVTKSADSYREIDEVITRSGLDQEATRRDSLYASFHSDIAAELCSTAVRVDDVIHQRHVFRFSGLSHLAAYVATSPKYQLSSHLAGDAAALAEALRHRISEKVVTTTSVVTYVVATPR